MLLSVEWITLNSSGWYRCWVKSIGAIKRQPINALIVNTRQNRIPSYLVIWFMLLPHVFWNQVFFPLSHYFHDDGISFYLFSHWVRLWLNHSMNHFCLQNSPICNLHLKVFSPDQSCNKKQLKQHNSYQTCWTTIQLNIILSFFSI